MSRLTTILITLLLAFTLAGCGHSKSTGGSDFAQTYDASLHSDAGSPSEGEQRIS